MKEDAFEGAEYFQSRKEGFLNIPEKWSLIFEICKKKHNKWLQVFEIVKYKHSELISGLTAEKDCNFFSSLGRKKQHWDWNKWD